MKGTSCKNMLFEACIIVEKYGFSKMLAKSTEIKNVSLKAYLPSHGKELQKSSHKSGVLMPNENGTSGSGPQKTVSP